MAIIPINPPKNVVIKPAVPAVTVEASECEIITISDNSVDEVKAVVRVGDYDKVLILWDATTNPTYAQIGNWTQQQANDRIVELL